MEIARTTVVATTATGAMSAPQPTAGLDRLVMLATQSFLRWRHFKTARTTLVPVPGPPTLPNNREIVFLTQSFLRWRHVFGSVAVCASCSAVARAPTARSDWPAVNLAKPFLR